MDYFDLEGLNNSTLTQLKCELEGSEFDTEALRGAFDFGTLVDNALTEKWKLDFDSLQCDGIQFDKETWDLGMDCADKIRESDIFSSFQKAGAKSQYIFIRTMDIDGSVKLKCKCKYDLLAKKIKSGADIKTTSCSSQSSFEKSITRLGYHRAAAFYMDIARIDYFWFLAISKVTKELFIYCIKRDDKLFIEGQQEYIDLCISYNNLIANV